MIQSFQWFTTIVNAGSLNRAAMILGQPQPMLSRKLQAFEKELGVPLFDRVGKKLVLTRAGQLTVEHAQRMLANQHAYLQQIAPFRNHSTERGKVTIGASLTTLQATLPELITQFRSDHPQTDIHAVTGKTHEIVSLVREKKVDLGIVAARVDQPDIHCVPMFDDHLCLVLPSNKTITLKHTNFDTIHALEGIPMVLFSSGTWYRVMIDQIFAQYGVKPDVHLEIDSFEAIVRLINTCQVAALLPESYVSSQLRVNSDLQVISLPELQQMTRTTSIIFMDPAGQSTVTRTFIDFVRNIYE